MNRKITFPELVDALSEVNGISKKINESLLKDFFALIQESLERGETVKIKKLGVFKVVKVEARKSINVNTGKEIEIPEHFKVNFAPDKELADEVNAAFADFETIELDDNISEEEINNDTDKIEVSIVPEIKDENNSEIVSEENTGNNNENLTTPSETSANDSSKNTEDDNETEETNNVKAPADTEEESEISDSENEESEKVEDIQESEQSDEIQTTEEEIDKSSTEENISEETADSIPEDKSITEEKATQIDAPQSEDTDYNYYDDEKPVKGKNNFYKGFFCGVLFATVVVLVSIYLFSVFAGFKITISNETEKTVTDTISTKAETIVQPIDSIMIDSIAEESNVENKIVLDTISRTRFLTTMAREYYGNFNFWVYIYEENKGILKNPDKIKLGTVVVIPSVSKYNIDKDNPQSIADAKKKATEIYSKYK